MKKTALILAVALIGVSAMAGFYLMWNTSYAFDSASIGQGEKETLWALVYTTGSIGTFSATSSNDGITDGSSTLTYKGDGTITASGASTVLAAVKSAGSTQFSNIDSVLQSGTSNTLKGTGKSDEYMGSLVNTFDGQNLSATDFPTSGYLYQAVFQLGSDGETVSYFVSDAASAGGFPVPPTPTASMYLETAGGTATQQTVLFDGTYTISTPVDVPEPATLSLLGLGALALAIRRRK